MLQRRSALLIIIIVFFSIFVHRFTALRLKGPLHFNKLRRAPVQSSTILNSSIFSDVKKWLDGRWFRTTSKPSKATMDISSSALVAGSPATPLDAVLIFGATGQTGLEIVREMLQHTSRDIVIASRNATKLNTKLDAAWMKDPRVFVIDGVDVTKNESFNKGIFRGVSQVVSCLGPAFNDAACTSEAIDYKANAKIVSMFKASLLEKSGLSERQLASVGAEGLVTALATPSAHSNPHLKNVRTQPLMEFSPASSSPSRPLLQDVSSWEPMDDSVMFGRSSSSWEAPAAGQGHGQGVEGDEGGHLDYRQWKGRVVTRGFRAVGFCGMKADLGDKAIGILSGGFDGLLLKVRGDGNRYKVRLQTKSGVTFKAAIDTNAGAGGGGSGAWQTVRIPFASFVPVDMNSVRWDVPRLPQASAAHRLLASAGQKGEKGQQRAEMRGGDDAATTISSIGLMISEYSFNDALNPHFNSDPSTGNCDFELDVASISLYSDIADLTSSAEESAEAPLSTAPSQGPSLNPRFRERLMVRKLREVQALRSSRTLFSMQPAEQGQTTPKVKVAVAPSDWRALDDTVMGGSSASSWTALSAGASGNAAAGGSWSGVVKVADSPGFCGTQLDLLQKGLAFTPADGDFDGLELKIRGDGNRYKFRLKTADGTAYKVAFDTIAGNTWTTVRLPFDTFVPVQMNRVLPASAAAGLLEQRTETGAKQSSATNQVTSLGLLLSEFNFNDELNPHFHVNPLTGELTFALDLAEVRLYKSPTPSFVMVSSAGAERIQRLDKEQRKRDIPIVQLNPQGILHWKYKGEEALRRSGLGYTIVRPTGLANVPAPVPDPPRNSSALASSEGRLAMDLELEDAVRAQAERTRNEQAKERDRLIELFAENRRLIPSQGDKTQGRITRKELAQLVVAALCSDSALGKTFEVRRDESDTGILVPANTPIAGPLPNNWGYTAKSAGKYTGRQDFSMFFRPLVRDSDRGTVRPDSLCGVAHGRVGAALLGEVSAESAPPLPYLPPLPAAQDPPID